MADLFQQFRVLGLPAVNSFFVMLSVGMHFRPGEEFTQEPPTGHFKSLGRAFKTLEKEGANQGYDLLLPAAFKVVAFGCFDEIG